VASVEYLSFLKEPVTLHLIIAAFLGSLLGLERELARKDPSLRTFMLICLGSCTFTLLSIHCAIEFASAANVSIPRADPGRIAAQIVVGIGFLGAGSIFRSRDRIMGLTTAALMWVAAGIGMAVGFDRFDLAFKATIVALSFMIILNLVHQVLRFFYPE
jgi:putative Mg2+ transporter-C (MgtC) family protein